jgi:hypothetical protein
MQGHRHVTDLSGPQAVQGHGAQAGEYAWLVPCAAMPFSQCHVANMTVLIFYAPVVTNGAPGMPVLPAWPPLSC